MSMQQAPAYRVRALLLTSVVLLLLFAQVGQLLTQAKPLMVLNPQLSSPVVPMADAGIDDILALPAAQWRTRPPIHPHHQWYRLQLDTSELSMPLLEVDYVLLDKLQLWTFTQGRQIDYVRTGDTLDFESRPVHHENFVFTLPASQTPLVLYFLAESKGIQKLPLRLWEANEFLRHNSDVNMVLGMFFGLLFIIGATNLFLYAASRNLPFILYSAYTLSVALFFAALLGLGYKYLWPHSQWLQEKGALLFALTAGLFVGCFVQALLQVKQNAPRLFVVMRVFLAALSLTLLLFMLLPYELMRLPIILLLATYVVFMLGCGIWLWRKGVAMASAYCLAWFILHIAAIVVCLDYINLVRLPFNSIYMLVLGVAIETTLLALLMTMQFNQQRQDLIQTQARAIEQERELRKAQERATEKESIAKQELEQEVLAHTLELQIALRELADKNRELEVTNTQDPLTGIKNRRFFDKHYLAEIRRSRREQTPMAVCMLDIDHFKRINDTHGHLIGDQCIQATAGLLKQRMKRSSDVLCRYGGEEFALILPNTDLDGAKALVDDIIHSLPGVNIDTPDGPLTMTLSAGVASTIATIAMPDDALLSLADELLYAAKQNGRNQARYRTLLSSSPDAITHKESMHES